MAAILTQSQLVAADLVYLLTVRFAGRDWRFSTRTLDVLTDDGEVLPYVGGVDDVEYVDEFDLFGDTPAVMSVPFEVIWPEDLSELIALGHDLGAATGELALHRVGDTWEERVVLLDGRVVDPEHGEAGEVVSFSLEEVPWDDAGTLIDTAAVVKQGVTWTDSSTAHEGATYPWVFGAPGLYSLSDGTSGVTGAVPAYIVDNAGAARYALVAGHRTTSGEEGGEVMLYNERLQEWVLLTADHLRDDLDRQCTVVNITTEMSRVPPLEPWTISDKMYAAFIQTSKPGGAYASHKPGAIRGAGDLIFALLEKSTMRWDRGRTIAAMATFNRFEVSGYGDDGSSPYKWILDNLAPLLPMSWARSAEGLYPVCWRWDATAKEAVAHLVEGRQYGLSRSGPVEYLGRSDVVNQITLSYALSKDTGDYQRSRTITGDPRLIGDTDVLSSAHARASRFRYGQAAETLTTDIVYSTACADLILLTKVLAKGFVRRVITFDATREWGWLRPGTVVTTTPSRLNISDQVGLVLPMKRSGSGLEIKVVLLEDPVRDLRLA